MVGNEFYWPLFQLLSLFFRAIWDGWDFRTENNNHNIFDVNFTVRRKRRKRSKLLRISFVLVSEVLVKSGNKQNVLRFIDSI